ncbi:CsgG/HfaB family protein [Spirochaetota bacterium]
MKKIIVCVIASLIFISYGASFAKLRFGVMKFNEEKDLSKHADVIKSHLYRELGSISYIIVIEKEKIDELLKEQEMSLSGLIDENYSVKIGKLLAANKMIFGNITKEGKITKVALKAVDVETGEVEFSGSSSAETHYEWEDKIKRILVDFRKIYYKKVAPSPYIEGKKTVITKLKKASMLYGDIAKKTVYVLNKKNVLEIKLSDKSKDKSDMDKDALINNKNSVQNVSYAGEQKIVGTPEKYLLKKGDDKTPLPTLFTHEFAAKSDKLIHPMWLNKNTLVFLAEEGKKMKAVYYFIEIEMFLEAEIVADDIHVSGENRIVALDTGTVVEYTIGF